MIEDGFKGTRLGGFLKELRELCDKYGIIMFGDIHFNMSRMLEIETRFGGSTENLLKKDDISSKNLKFGIMATKVLNFTDKVNGKSKEIRFSELGRHVFDITKSIDDFNAAVRWCNKHNVGDVFENENYKFEIIGIQ